MTIWFRAKRYGWGWTPTTWQGWLVLAVWILLNVWWFRSVDAQSHSVSDTLIGVAPLFILSTVIFLALCYTKGERPHWRWGDDTQAH